METGQASPHQPSTCPPCGRHLHCKVRFQELSYPFPGSAATSNFRALEICSPHKTGSCEARGGLTCLLVVTPLTVVSCPCALHSWSFESLSLHCGTQDTSPIRYESTAQGANFSTPLCPLDVLVSQAGDPLSFSLQRPCLGSRPLRSYILQCREEESCCGCLLQQCEENYKPSAILQHKFVLVELAQILSLWDGA